MVIVEMGTLSFWALRAVKQGWLIVWISEASAAPLLVLFSLPQKFPDRR